MPNPIINQLTIKSGNQTILYDIGVNAKNVEQDDESTFQDKLNEKQDVLTFDEIPTRDSENLVTSGGVYNSLNAKLDKSAVGVPEGTASLDSNGKVPITQLPSYVDDVVEYSRKSEFPSAGEREKIYIALDTNLTYRYGSSDYLVPILRVK